MDRSEIVRCYKYYGNGTFDRKSKLNRRLEHNPCDRSLVCYVCLHSFSCDFDNISERERERKIEKEHKWITIICYALANFMPIAYSENGQNV